MPDRRHGGGVLYSRDMEICVAGDDLIPPSPKYDPTAAPPPDDAVLFAESEPFALFESWFKDAKEKEPNDPNGMALATADAAGFPDVRMVLLKGVDGDGFVFYTNGESAKGASSKRTRARQLCFIGRACAAKCACAASSNSFRTRSPTLTSTAAIAAHGSVRGQANNRGRLKIVWRWRSASRNLPPSTG